MTTEEFNQLIEILSLPVQALIEEQESGVEVSNLLDIGNNTNTYFTSLRLHSQLGQYSAAHINRNFASPVLPDTRGAKSTISLNGGTIAQQRKIGVDIVQNPSIHCDRS